MQKNKDESGARRLKKTSQLLGAGKLVGLQPERAEKAVSLKQDVISAANSV
ncbi:hypothetical protein HQN89_04700 [Paenibacillus frigoriresistens]|uniref:hypothetical protein n=1 Tax=Paenibacillus alginolyticus TaxID=59839 RepID=UPI0015642923|nr:hypothetical protein [Paenibacillus frigoriresistens]NRF90335.1 hypothetical protein [Paenibacillus frigoriresistens]